MEFWLNLCWVVPSRNGPILKPEPGFNFGVKGRAKLASKRSAEATLPSPSPTSEAKTPRTERGRKTLRAILDAAAAEFGEKGFHEGSISGITGRAGVALGSFYTYFDSKEEVFKALVRDMSAQVRDHVGPRVQQAADELDAERIGLESFLSFVRTHKEIYRIIDEAEFVDQESYRLHYASSVDRIRARLEAGAARGEVRADVGEVHAWAIMGMNVFLGLRYGVWNEDKAPEDVASLANDMLRRGLAP